MYKNKKKNKNKNILIGIATIVLIIIAVYVIKTNQTSTPKSQQTNIDNSEDQDNEELSDESIRNGTGDAGYYAKKTDWDELSNGKMNISVYTFIDSNRNGQYDLGDSPMVDVAVEMQGEGVKHVERSNSDGYANFVMSATQDEASIKKPGEYSFQVIAPPKWLVTSQNVQQKNHFAQKNGSPGDFIATDSALSPVGLAPELIISGTIPVNEKEKNAIGNTKIQVKTPKGEVKQIELTQDGRFEVPAFPGQWEVTATNEQQKTIRREISVKDYPVVLSALRFDKENNNNDWAVQTINFEDLTDRNILKVPNGYGGMRWWNMIVTEQMLYGGAGYKNGTTSGHNVCYNSSGHPAELSNPDGFNFEGGNFSVSWSNVEGETLKFRALRNTEVVAEDEIILSVLGPVSFDASYKNITKLELSTAHYWQLVGDDFRIAVNHKQVSN